MRHPLAAQRDQEEYVFRHNRRVTTTAVFHTLLGLGALHEPTTDRQITRRRAA